MRHLRKLALVLAVAATLGLAGQPAFAGTVHPDDPGAYCRLAMVNPSLTGTFSDGTGYYGFGSQAHAYITCNGPAYWSVITVQFHYSTTETSTGQNLGSGIIGGSSHTCSGSCDGYAYYTRSGLHCGETYAYADYGTASASYKKTSSSAQVNLSGTSGTTRGSSHDPSPPC